MQVQLRRIAHSRSGDKGNISNIAVIAWHPDFYEILRAQLTPQVVSARLAGVVQGRVTRYEVPGLHALNFVCEEALGGGVSRNLCLDNYGKSLSAALLDLPVTLPEALRGHLRGPER